MSGVEIPVADLVDAPDSVRFSGMVRVPGGTFRMGSDRHYPEEAPVHRVTVDGFWIDRTPVTNRAIPRVRRRDRPCHFRRDPARPEGLSGRTAAHAQGGFAGFHAAEHPVDLRDWSQWWTFHIWRQLAATLMAAQLDQRARRSSGRPCRLFATPKPMRTGPARICRPRPNGSSPRAAASTGRNSPGATNSRQAAGIWRIPGRASSRVENLSARRLRAHLAGDGVPAERLRRLRHDRQCLGMDQRLVLAEHEADAPKACCIPENPRGGREDASYDPPAEIRFRARCLRAARICARRITAAATGRPRACRAGRHVDQPCRVSMRRRERSG